MDPDELFAKRPDDTLVQLTRQDLDPLSVDELDERIAILRAEIARIEAKKQQAVNHKLSAEALFKR
jgi:uncharacterized small protein (DUF1192 family)